MQKHSVRAQQTQTGLLAVIIWALSSVDLSDECIPWTNSRLLNFGHDTQYQSYRTAIVAKSSRIQCSVAAPPDSQRKKNKWRKTDHWVCCIDFDHLFSVSLSALLLLHSTVLQLKSNSESKWKESTLKKSRESANVKIALLLSSYIWTFNRNVKHLFFLLKLTLKM